MSVKLLIGHCLECLSLKGGCTGSSESTLVKKTTLFEITCHGSFDEIDSKMAYEYVEISQLMSLIYYKNSVM